MQNKSTIKIEVAYAKPSEQVIVPLDVPIGTTVMQAIVLSGLTQRFPEIDLEQSSVGIFAKVIKGDHLLAAGDRVEIYRPLIADPKSARKQRAARRAKEKKR
ncbi:MAG: RnfH family protein [Gammaproteobacteria bacterium]|nr:RnfH family protein [Gammaproteobacteria bacterium]